MSEIRMTSEKMYERDVLEIKESLKTWLDSGVRVYVLLQEVERRGNWHAHGASSFSEFLSMEFPNSLGTHRYDSVIRAIKVYGRDVVERVGPECAHALINNRQAVENKTVRDAIIADIRSDGFAPTPFAVQKLVRKHVGSPQSSSIAEAAEQRRKSETAVDRLKAEVKSLKELKERLERELDAALKKLVKVEKERDELKKRVVVLSKQKGPRGRR